jgi:hypothetical protein
MTWLQKLYLLGWLPLAACDSPADRDRVLEERWRRNQFARDTLLASDAGRQLRVASGPTYMFEEGFSAVLTDPPDDYHAHAFRWMGKQGHVRLHRQDTLSILSVAGWVNEKVLRTKPVITAYLDGQVLGTTGSIENGHFRLELTVPTQQMTREWMDLTLQCNTVAFHWSEPPELRVIVVYEFAWHPRH